MNSKSSVPRPILWFLLVLMPIVAILGYRSGDPAFAAMAATWTLFAALMLRFGSDFRSGPPRIVGVALSVLMVIVAVATLVT